MALPLGLYIAFAFLRVRLVPRVPRVRMSAFRLYPRTTSEAFALLRRARFPRKKRRQA
jgi:hypothetical protein